MRKKRRKKHTEKKQKEARDLARQQTHGPVITTSTRVMASAEPMAVDPFGLPSTADPSAAGIVDPGPGGIFLQLPAELTAHEYLRPQALTQRRERSWGERLTYETGICYLAGHSRHCARVARVLREWRLPVVCVRCASVVLRASFFLCCVRKCLNTGKVRVRVDGCGNAHSFLSRTRRRTFGGYCGSCDRFRQGSGGQSHQAEDQ